MMMMMMIVNLYDGTVGHQQVTSHRHPSIVTVWGGECFEL